MIARQLVLGAVDLKFMTIGVAYIARRRYIINTSLPGFGGQYDETLHSCAAFSLAYGLGKYLYTLTQYLAILPTKPGNKIYIYATAHLKSIHETDV